MYVGDFYNQAVIHNDTRGPDHNNVNAAVRPDRDHYFGRIWKIDHKEAKKIAVPDLSKAGVEELVEGAGASEQRGADDCGAARSWNVQTDSSRDAAADATYAEHRDRLRLAAARSSRSILAVADHASPHFRTRTAGSRALIAAMDSVLADKDLADSPHRAGPPKLPRLVLRGHGITRMSHERARWRPLR